MSAFEILAITKNNLVCHYALNLINNGENFEDGLSILFTNYRPEDEGIVFSLLKKIKVGYTDSKWHGLYRDAIKWIERDKNAPAIIILYLYENTLCSSCREIIVNVMYKRKLLDSQLLKECLFDSNQDIRKLAQKIYKSTNRLSCKF